jgi:hypothetical protein
MADFEKASRLKLRFDTELGQLSVEDLWDLPLTSETRVNLDDIAHGLDAQLTSVRKSFVRSENAVDNVLQLKFDTVIAVIEWKQAEGDRIKNEKANAERKQKLLKALDDAEEKELLQMGKEALREEIAKL